jgi:hypothetical protein
MSCSLKTANCEFRSLFSFIPFVESIDWLITLLLALLKYCTEFCLCVGFINLIYVVFRSKHLTNLEKLLISGRDSNPSFFTESTRFAGEYWLTYTLDFLLSVEPTSLHAHPKLNAFFDVIIETPAFSDVRTLPFPEHCKRDVLVV